MDELPGDGMKTETAPAVTRAVRGKEYMQKHSLEVR